MADRVFINPRIERLLEQMGQQTNAPAVAAQRARQIIEALIQGQKPIPGLPGQAGPDGPAPAGMGLMRYRKDKRVKNSLKFNLGKGYRLICIKEKNEIYVMFVGDHDSSDAWLDHFTKKHPHKTEQEMAVFSVEEPSTARSNARHKEEDPFYDPLPKEIPQEMLRRVFSGLCAAD